MCGYAILYYTFSAVSWSLHQSTELSQSLSLDVLAVVV